MARTVVWISFADEDESWARWVRSHLESVGQGVYFEVRDHRGLSFREGDEHSARAEAIGNAAVALPVISRFYLTSGHVSSVDIPTILSCRKNGLLVIPILASPCPWRTVEWLHTLQMFPRGGRSLAGSNEFQVDEHLADLAMYVFNETPLRAHVAEMTR
jgi:hypothetical protein